MVRSDLMWAIDQSLRVNRGRPREPFGGVRLIMFGDLHQLPPVVQEARSPSIWTSEYGGPFFFSLGALREGAGTTLLELEQVFRQKRRGAARRARTASATATAERGATSAVLNERVHADPDAVARASLTSS